MVTATSAHQHHDDHVQDHQAADVAHAASGFTDYPTYRVNQLPALQGKFDPLDAWNGRVFGRIKSESLNDGLAFSLVPRDEKADKVYAIVFVNNHTATTPRPTIEDLIHGKRNTTPELSVQLRGPILMGLGKIEGIEGVRPGTTAQERAEKVAKLIDINPRVGNLVGKYEAALDVRPGEHINFLNSISIKARHLPDVIRDLSNANNTNGNQHVGALRMAQVLEATMRQFEYDGILPPSGSNDVISIDRFKANKPGTVTGADKSQRQELPAVVSDDDEPPF